MAKTWTNFRTEKRCLFLNMVFLFLSLCFVNNSFANQKEVEDFPWEMFLPAIIVNPNTIDNDGDGYTEDQGDCNDKDSNVYPGANEVCGDGIDQDCDGSDRVCRRLLNVPFVRNYGGTCVASSFTMVMQYYNTGVTFDDVFNIFGLPPFDQNEYGQFEEWIEDNFNLEMLHFYDRTVDDVINCIDAGYPVVVHQQYRLNIADGHLRVVIGYNLKENVFILNDPSDLGPNYRMTFETFERLWYLITQLEPVPKNQIFLIFPTGEPIPLD